MLEDLSSKDKVVGLKQVRRAIVCGRAGHVFLARDADPRLTGPLEDCCREAGVPVSGGYTMAQLGRACGIDVPTAAAALLAKEKPLPTEYNFLFRGKYRELSHKSLERSSLHAYF